MVYVYYLNNNKCYVYLGKNNRKNSRQLFILFEAFEFFIGTIYSFKLHRKEFKSFTKKTIKS
ncbi:hypothetical protein E0M28_14855 [Bacillus toyonensis]|nr:hypothetical protein E0M28_14855 [Bacillus toyonensis]